MGKLSKLSRNKRTEAAKRSASERPAHTTANKQRKLARHVLIHPTDLQAQQK